MTVELTFDEPSLATNEVWRAHTNAIVAAYEELKHLKKLRVVDPETVVEIFEVKSVEGT